MKQSIHKNIAISGATVYVQSRLIYEIRMFAKLPEIFQE